MKTLLFFANWLLTLLFTVTGVHAGTESAAAPAAQPQIVWQAWQVHGAAESGSARERLQPLQNIRPGDVVEYEARYVNSTRRKAEDVQLTLPVPAGGMQYLPQATSATPVHSASVDGVRFEPVPLRRAVKRADGLLQIQEVPLSEYRFLRWNLGDLPAGAHRAVRARMQLPQLASANRP